jgi:hypothetical protein
MNDFAALQTAILESIAVVVIVFGSIIAVTFLAYWWLFSRPTAERVDEVSSDELVIHMYVGPCLSERDIAEIESENVKGEENEAWSL